MSMETWLLITVSLISAIVFIFFVMLIFIYISTSPYPNLSRDDREKGYVDPKFGSNKPFPFSLKNPGTIQLSVIVPAYNEEERLPVMMDEALKYLEERNNKTNFKYEIIIVDDGSNDKTTLVGLQYVERYGSEKVRVLTLTRNKGKGGAVRMGMLSARGKQLLFADADGATKFADIEKLEAAMKPLCKRQDSSAIVCGSRAHLQDESIAKRSFFRSILMYGFHFWVWFLCVRSIKDTQCGFKLFTRSAAFVLFHNLHVERWAFDVDLLYLASYFKFPVDEVPVTWTEIEGSKIIPIFSWLQMGKDILLIRLRYALGAWKIEPMHKLE